MKEYFFLNGKDQSGPFTFEQLADKELTSETLIWTEGMENWKKLKEIPELFHELKPKSVPPPPPPTVTEEKISKTEVSGQLKVTNEKPLNPTLEAIKPSKTTLSWLIVWCSFHLFALLMSYSQISFFNNSGKPETKEFWPFVTYNYCGDNPYWDKEHKRRGDWYESCFEGVLANYDWSEFIFYVGGAIVIYLLVVISNKKEEGIE